MKISKILLLASLFSLGACESIPPLDFAVANVDVVDNRKDAELRSLTVGYATKENQLGKIQTNHLIPPLWKESLTDALNRSLTFTDDSDLKVNLAVKIVEFDIPEAGVTMTSTAGATYEIFDRSTGKVIFKTTIQTDGVVPMDYAFLGIARAQESMNRAVRNNVMEFISVLDSSNFEF